MSLFKGSDPDHWHCVTYGFSELYGKESTDALAEAMGAALKPVRGSYRWPSIEGFTLKVVPTKIKDQDGKVTEVVG